MTWLLRILVKAANETPPCGDCGSRVWHERACRMLRRPIAAKGDPT